jgi:hypothetical protein
MCFGRNHFGHGNRVARWYIFKPKIPIWEKFGGPLNGKCWFSLWSFGTFYGHLVYLWAFGNVVIIGSFFTVLVHCVKKNLATLHGKRQGPEPMLRTFPRV